MIPGRADGHRELPRPPLVAVAVVALVGVLAARAQLVLHACLPGEGPLGWLGLRLALLRTSVDCPEGSLALGGSTARSALVVVSIALPTLLVHLLAATCGVSLSALLARAASGIREVLGAGLRVLPGAPRAPWVRAALVVGRDLAMVPTRVLATRHPDRGPPA